MNKVGKKAPPYLSENGVAIVGEHDTSHGVEEHLEHGFRSEGGPDNVRDGLGSLNVGSLGLLALFTFGVLVQNHDGHCLVV